MLEKKNKMSYWHWLYRIFQELYQLSSTGETDNLKTTLTKLQEENKKLRMQFEVTASTQPGEGMAM